MWNSYGWGLSDVDRGFMSTALDPRRLKYKKAELTPAQKQRRVKSRAQKQARKTQRNK